MNKALIQHAEDDIHRDNRSHNQPDGISQRGLEGERATLELGRNICGQVKRFFGVQNRLYRITQRMFVWHVERDGGDRELIEVVNRQRGKTLFNTGDCAERYYATVATGQTYCIQCRKPRRIVGVMF